MNVKALKNIVQIVSYNQTYNELTVQSELYKYVYNNVTPFLYNKLCLLLKQNRYGQVWQTLCRLDLLSKETINA